MYRQPRLLAHLYCRSCFCYTVAILVSVRLIACISTPLQRGCLLYGSRCREAQSHSGHKQLLRPFLFLFARIPSAFSLSLSLSPNLPKHFLQCSFCRDARLDGLRGSQLFDARSSTVGAYKIRRGLHCWNLHRGPAHADLYVERRFAAFASHCTDTRMRNVTPDTSSVCHSRSFSRLSPL